MQHHETASLLHHLVSLLSRESDQILHEQLGIGLSQYKIMTTLRDHPHILQRTIATTLGQTEASISRQIRLLTERGVLQARRNPLNQREHLTDLTPKGERLITAADQALSTYHQLFLAGLSDKEQTKLHDLLGQVHRSICFMQHPGVTDTKT